MLLRLLLLRAGQPVSDAMLCDDASRAGPRLRKSISAFSPFPLLGLALFLASRYAAHITALLMFLFSGVGMCIYVCPGLN